jgi:hypothetical protein
MSAADTKTFIISDHVSRRDVAALVSRLPEGWTVTIKPPQRTLAQSARFHAMVSEITAAGFAIDNRPLTFRETKVAFVSGWLIEEGHGSDIVKGLQGEPVQLVRSTTTFSTRELASLIDYTTAECDQRRIPLRRDRS